MRGPPVATGPYPRAVNEPDRDSNGKGDQAVVRSRWGILRPLRHRDFRLLWTGQVVSFVGDGIYAVAIAWQVYELTDDDPAALALVGIAWTLPVVLLSLGVGVLADRFDRRRLLIGADLLRLFAIGGIGFLSLAGSLTMPWVIGLVVVFGIGQAVFHPSLTSLVPTIVPGSLLVEANSLAQFVRPVALTLLGPLLGGMIITVAGVGWAFIADAATFAVSAVAVAMIRTRPAHPGAQERTTSAWTEAKEGLAYVRDQRWILIALLAATVSLLCVWGPWEALVPYIVRVDLDGSAADLGLIFAAGGVSSVLVAVTLGQRGTLPRKPITVLYLAWGLGMLMTAGFGVVTTVWQAAAVAFVSEGSITVLIIVWYTLLQRLVPTELLGRVSSLDWLVSAAGVPVSFAIVGPVAGAIGVDATLIGAGLLGGFISVAFMFVRGARDPERDGSLEAADRSSSAS
jgi:MFS family permease